jgi:hypothetical protein
MHRMLEAISAHPSRNPGGWETSIASRSSTWGGVSALELIETLEYEERRRVQLEDQGAPIAERVEQAATVALLASAVRQHYAMVSAYCVVSTYDPDGSFRPGADVVWSGHLSQEEAERVMVWWQAHLNRANDVWRVEYQPVAVHYMKRDGWEPQS